MTTDEFFRDVKRLLSEAGATQTQLAARLKMDTSQLSRLVNGKIANPSYATMERIAVEVELLTGVSPW